MANFLASGHYSTLKRLCSFFNERLDIKGNEIVSPLTIFPIMDLDDCTPSTAVSYQTGEMFRHLSLRPRIVPIYNGPNLDEVMAKMGFPIDKRNKPAAYERMFPANSGGIEAVRSLRDQFYSIDQKTVNTNMYIFLDACLQEAEKRLIV